MNILLVTQYFWPESFRINDLAQGLVEKGHRVTVLTGKPNYPDGKIFPGYTMFGGWRQEHQGLTIIRCPLLPRGDGGAIRLFLNYLTFAVSASIAGLLSRLGPVDAILVYEPSPFTVGIPAVLLRKRFNCPLLFWVQDLWPESLSATGAIQSRTILGLVGRMVKAIYRRCDLVLIQSRAFFDPVVKQGVAAGRIRYFPNSAEAFYTPLVLEADAPERRQIPAGFVVMFGGNIGAAQSFETVLSAAEKLAHIKDIHWVVFGDGRLAGWVKAEIKARGLTDCFHMMGRIPPESIPRYYSAAAALLVSLADEAVFDFTIPAKLQSYLACGKPILAALNGEGARVARESGSALVSPAEDAGLLSENVLRLYQMPASERQQMGRRGRAYFEAEFDRDMLIERLEDWLHEASGAAPEIAAS